MRRFAAVFGATTPAVAAVLAGMFFGLAVGGAMIGRRAARIARPVRAYGCLETGVAIGALLVEPLLMLYQRMYPALYDALGGSTVAFVAVKTVLTVAAVFVPSFGMGGTIPLLGHAMTGSSRRLGVQTAPLYAANTFGAAIGALSVPFLLLPNFSARICYGGSVAASLLVGVLAFLLDRPVPIDATAVAPRQRISSLAVLAGISGAALFILQVAWSRMFAQVHENSIYSFSLVVAVLLVGLAGATAIAKFFMRRGIDPRRLLAIGWISGGTIVLVTPLLFYYLTDGLSYLGGKWDFAYGLKLLRLTIPTVLLPVLAAGMVLPALMEMAGKSSDRPSGALLGSLLAANTAGSILGALVAAFVLPAALGLWLTLSAVGAVMVVCGPNTWKGRAIVATLVVTAFFVTKPTSIPRTKFRPDQGEKLLAIHEGGHGIVAVVERGDSRRIKLNNFYVLGGTASTGDERIQAHLPLLLHPAPRRAAFLGLGTGITAGAALLHPLESITAVEIVPEVIDAARDHFADANLRVLESPHVAIIAEDARSFLSTSVGRFDVIVGDLFVPWHQGEALLYTADHFQTVQRALAPGGIFCQWLPMFQLSEEEFNIVAATFLDVFPSATLWRGDFSPKQPALALIAYNSLDPAIIERRVRELKPDVTNSMLAHPAGVWLYFVGPLQPTMDRFRTARRNREDRPWLEILGPRSHAGSSHGTAELFVGRRLEDFLNTIRSMLMKSLSDAENSWREAGAQLGTATILQSEGKPGEAAQLMQAVGSKLPAELRPLFGPAGN